MSHKSSDMTQKVLSTSLFILAIAFGMHVAGQTPSGADASAAPPATMPAAMPGTMPAAMPGAMPPATSPAQPSAADLQNMMKAQMAAPKAGSNGPPDTIPAFGAAAAKYADDVGKDDSPKPTPPKKEVFVPSEVETYIPHRAKAVDPRMILHTSMGDIGIRLFANYAPKNVHTVIDLARGDREFTDVKTGRATRRPFYNDLLFHRVVSGFLIQTGCPFGTGRGGPGFTNPDEINSSLRFNKAGMVAMAPAHDSEKSERKNSNGSQFFITLAPMPDWDDKFTIIGVVEKGLSVVEKISKAPAGPTERPIRRIYLNSVEVTEEVAASPDHKNKK